MVWIAGTVVLSLHLLAMNLASAGPLLCVWLQVRHSRGRPLAGAVGRDLAATSVAALLLGSVLGFVQLGLLWLAGDSEYWQVLRRFPPAAYVYFLVEIGFSLVCLVAFLTLWKRGKRHPWLHGVLALLASTNLLYHFPPLMASISRLSERPTLILDETITRPLVREVMSRPEVLAVTLHFALASIAVGGVATMLIGQRALRELQDDEHQQARAAIVRGGGIAALGPSLAQMVAGVWLLSVLPANERNAMMGANGLVTLLFVASLVTALALMHALAAVVLGETTSRQTRRCGWLLLAVVLLMVAAMLGGRAGSDSGSEQVKSRASEQQPLRSAALRPWY